MVKNQTLSTLSDARDAVDDDNRSVGTCFLSQTGAPQFDWRTVLAGKPWNYCLPW
jgi:hypothetical protein